MILADIKNMTLFSKRNKRIKKYLIDKYLFSIHVIGYFFFTVHNLHISSHSKLLQRASLTPLKIFN